MEDKNEEGKSDENEPKTYSKTKSGATKGSLGVYEDPESTIKVAPKIFTTREIGRRYLDREAYLKLCIREMLIYVVFLIVIGMLALSQHDLDEYYLTQTMTKLFVEKQFRCLYTYEKINYLEINTVEHIWSYFNHYLENTYWIYWYDYEQRVALASPAISDAILHENKLIGRPRVRMVKVKKDSCSIPDEVKNLFNNCYAEYSSSAEDKEDFTPAETNVSQAFIYHSESELNSLPMRGEVSTYGGGGYYFDFKERLDDTNSSLNELLSQNWIDRSTRAVILQFSTHSINEQIFFTLTLLFEIPPSGAVIPSYVIHTHKLVPKFLWHESFVLLYIIFVLFMLWYTVEELYEITYFKSHYFDSFWNFLDLLILFHCYAVVVYFVYQFILIQPELGEFLFKMEGFVCLDKINSAKETYMTLLLVLFFISAIKAVKYLKFNHCMYKMQTAVHRIKNDIACFLIIFLIIFMVFSQFGHALFGSQVREFKSFLDSAFTLLQIAIGNFDFFVIEETNNFLGPIYFFVYIFFIYFILVNVFLAIVINTYSEVHSNFREQNKNLYISDILGRCFRKMLRLCGMKKFADKHEQPPPKPAVETSTYDAIQKLLKRCRFNDFEIDSFFSKFDIPKDKLVTKEELRLKIIQKLNLQDSDLSKKTAKKEEEDKLGESLKQRINDLEKNITDVNQKIDLIDTKIDSIQKLRARKMS